MNKTFNLVIGALMNVLFSALIAQYIGWYGTVPLTMGHFIACNFLLAGYAGGLFLIVKD